MGHTTDVQIGMTWRELDDLVTRVVETRAATAALQAKEAELLADAAELVLPAPPSDGLRETGTERSRPA